MHEALLLGISASELTVLLTSDPRRWSRRLVLFVTLMAIVVCYAWFIVRVDTLALVTGTVLALVWFAWDLADGSARSVLARWALAAMGFVALMSVDAVSHPTLALLPGRPFDLIIAVVFLMTGPANHLITAILLCARGRSRDPVPGWINAPVLPAMPESVETPDTSDTQVDGAAADHGDEEAPLTPSSELPPVSWTSKLKSREWEGTALRGGRWIGPLERLLIIILAGAGAEVAIGAVVAAKGVIRFPEISQDSSGEKAEEFLIGSVSSWILAALVAMFVRVVLV